MTKKTGESIALKPKQFDKIQRLKNEDLIVPKPTHETKEHYLSTEWFEGKKSSRLTTEKKCRIAKNKYTIRKLAEMMSSEPKAVVN
jgi:hypothetical protein